MKQYTAYFIIKSGGKQWQEELIVEAMNTFHAEEVARDKWYNELNRHEHMFRLKARPYKEG